MSVLTLVLTAVQTASLGAPPTSVPFRVGERFEYGAKLGLISVGKASIQVAAIDTIRGEPVFHFQYNMDASAFLGVFKLNSTLESWTSIDRFTSLRYRQDNKQNGRQFVRQFEIFPDSSRYRQVEPDPLASQPSVAEPLDDASFLFFIRSTPLELGQTYRFNRYFRADRNPIVIKVLKRERMELPDGTKVDCLVLNPVVGERGLFAKRNDARLWLTDDVRRIPVQIRSNFEWGQITLRLQRMVVSE
jgi:uncharacterized protein DUF3108